jgi:hypothetical protein
MPNVEREVIELYVWELKDKCRSDRYWGAGEKWASAFMCGAYSLLMKPEIQVPIQWGIRITLP